MIGRRCATPAGLARIFAAVTTLAAVALVAASCGGSVGQTSGIHGIVLFAGGPPITSPSPLPGGSGSGRQGRPYPSVTVQVTARGGADDGRVVARIKPDAEALFTIPLPPGTYELKPLVPKNGPWPQPTTVVVGTGRFSRALVSVQGR